MAGTISRRPAGLLDLLLTQQQGDNPSVLGDTVWPGIDLGPFYDQERLTITNGSSAFTGLAQTNTMTIPSGESWRLLAFGLRGSFATANQYIQLGFQIGGVSGSASVDIDARLFTAVGATDLYSGSFPWVKGNIIFPSGTNFRTKVESLNLDAQANLTVSVNALYVRMDT